MSKAMTDKRKRVAAVAVFSLLLIPLLAVSPTGFDLNNFIAMAQEQASTSSSSNQTEIVVAQTLEEQANLLLSVDF
jgi:hypothetical protein